MRLIGQRWEYRIANASVCVDNAYSYSLWTQERLVVNDETVKHSGGRLRFFQKYEEPWLTPLGEGMLDVKLISTVGGITCKVRLDGELLEPTERYEATWSGPALSWPGDEEWRGLGEGRMS